jgi:hypothetical protein
MSEEMSQVGKFVRGLAAGVFYLLIGIAWSRITWRRGISGFDLGWLLLAVVLSRLLCVQLGMKVSNAANWLIILLPLGPGFVFEWIADTTLHRFYHDASKARLVAFAVSTCIFLIYILVWVVLFAYEESFGPGPGNDRIAWRRVLYATASILGAFLIWRTVACFAESAGSSSVVTVQSLFLGLKNLELLFYRASLLIYALLTLRMFFPMAGGWGRTPP